MFTGIITDLGHIEDIQKTGDWILKIKCSYDIDTISIGASIATNGCCLTVIEKGRDWYTVQVSEESLNKTNLRQLAVGDRVNLERALKIGDELGGHIVSGHVDGVGEIMAITPENESKRFTFKVPQNLKHYVAEKGSITIDGISLTVNEVDDDTFGVNVIPHTQQETNLGFRKPGDYVNLEIDMLARYVARMLGKEE
jgi:riboflavin synthase